MNFIARLYSKDIHSLSVNFQKIGHKSAQTEYFCIEEDKIFLYSDINMINIFLIGGKS